jgi:hypothetical protein
MIYKPNVIIITIFLFLTRKVSKWLKYRTIIFLNAGDSHSKIKKRRHVEDLIKLISMDQYLSFFVVSIFSIDGPYR